MPVDTVPADLMNEKRLAFSRSLGLASAIPFTVAPVEDLSLRELPPAPAATTQTSTSARPQIVGEHTLTGREWLVVQLPDGRIRATFPAPNPDGGDGSRPAWNEARRLAAAESGQFAVFQPRGISRPETTVTDELL